MDTTRFTDPITDRVPTDQAAALLSTVTGATSGLAHQIGDHLDDIDLGDTARKTRDMVASVVPWMSVSRRPFWMRRWVLATAAGIVVVAAITLIRRRAGDRHEPPPRDDWSTGSPNGVSPTNREAQREPAPTGV